jgi:hypothetical protein
MTNGMTQLQAPERMIKSQAPERMIKSQAPERMIKSQAPSIKQIQNSNVQKVVDAW